MKVAILGANSFLARAILPTLAATGAELILFSRQPARAAGGIWQRFDLPAFPVDSAVLAGADAIVFAVAAGVQRMAQPLDDGTLYWVNAGYPLRLMAELEIAGWKGRWISFGSYFEIGDHADAPLTEAGVLGSLRALPNTYCATKRMLTRGVVYGRWSFPLHHFILPTIYGPGEEVARLIPYVLDCLAKGETPRLSAGTQTRQYLHTADIARLLVHTLAGKLPAGCFNAAPADCLTVADLVRTIYRVAGCKLAPPFATVTTRDESMRFLALDATRLQAAAGWRAERSLEDGVRDYLSGSP